MQRDEPISFFIPAYNCEHTLQESVESIIQGNFNDGDELIIVNDGSIDQTDQVLQRLKEKYPGKITTLKHSRNKGGGAARNTAIEHSKYRVLFCLDADNILVPGSIQRLKEFMLNSEADAASFHEVHYFIDSINNVPNKWIYKLGIVSLSDQLSSHQIPGSSGNYMFTKESWLRANGYPEHSGALDTWGFALRQLATGTKMVVMPNSFYYHRHGLESYWIRECKKGKTDLTALQLLIPYLDLISETDVDYIFSREGRNSWFLNLERRPIRLKGIQHIPSVETTFQSPKGNVSNPFMNNPFKFLFSSYGEGFGKTVWFRKRT